MLSNLEIFNWNRSRGGINTSGTRYEFIPWSRGVWVSKGMGDFFRSERLRDMDDFLSLKGEVVDLNPRSQVRRIRLGNPEGTFYLKAHEDYVKCSLKTFFRPLPMVMKELNNLMRYAKTGFDRLEPVAWGWRPRTGGGDSFLLVSELEGFRPLIEWLTDEKTEDTPSKRRKLRKAVALMIAAIHRAGLAHVDLFSWHIFVKQTGEALILQPIDLERTKVRGFWPWSPLRIYLKQVSDLAALHLTVPITKAGYGERLNFFLTYRGHRRLTFRDKHMLRLIIKEAKRRGVKMKFEPYGVAEELNGK